MGCDFYTYYVVRIEYKKDGETKVESEEIEDTRERHYFWEIDGRDSDFEELNDYYERCHRERQNQIDNELSHYPRKDIFKNGMWLCVQSSREKYITICKKLNIAQKDVVSIWKEGDFHYR
jgi:hypothetical protein